MSANLKEVFSKLDKDGSGEINFNEFKELLRVLGENRELTEEQWKAYFALVNCSKKKIKLI